MSFPNRLFFTDLGGGWGYPHVGWSGCPPRHYPPGGGGRHPLFLGSPGTHPRVPTNTHGDPNLGTYAPIYACICMCTHFYAHFHVFAEHVEPNHSHFGCPRTENPPILFPWAPLAPTFFSRVGAHPPPTPPPPEWSAYPRFLASVPTHPLWVPPGGGSAQP